MAHAALADWIGDLRVGADRAPELKTRDPAARPHGMSREKAAEVTNDAIAEIARMQYLLYADSGSSLLIVLQGLDAAGKDGTIRHVFTGMNPQGVRVTAFKQPTAEEAAHDFLWRVHKAAPRNGEVAIFNRSHYEDVLVPRVHDLVPSTVWTDRYERINDFERLLATRDTVILKFFLHLSSDEQLDRFEQRLKDPARQWKISESDYTERAFRDAYMDAYEEAIARTSRDHAPWYVIPADRKWVRNLAIARIIADALGSMTLRTPPVRVDLADIRRRYHEARKKG